MSGILALLVVAVLIVVAIGLYNSLVSLRNQVGSAWAQIDVQLKRRHDLIPNLVETVKGYAKHEQETLEKVIQARNMAVGARGVAEHARPLGPFTLRLHGHATAVHSRDPMGVPLAFRLQHEGHAALRGYALETGTLAGHNVAAVGKVELELPLVPKWGLSVAGFADAGWRYNADAAWGPRGALLQRSVGVSVIWRSPIGVPGVAHDTMK